MSYQTSKTSTADFVAVELGGLDRTAPLCGGKTSFELRNFRRTKWGSLRERDGIAPVVTFDENIRGAISIKRGGVREVYVVAGQTVYFLKKEGKKRSAVAIGNLTTNEGKVTFLQHDGHLILLDGAQLWSLTPENITRTPTYIPLYGREWAESTNSVRDVYELPNLLSNRLRLHFRTVMEGKIFRLGDLVPVSVDAALVNGKIYRKAITYNATMNQAELSDILPKNSEVELFLTMPEEFAPIQSNLKTAHSACAIGRAEDARILFYDIEGTRDVRISRAIPKRDRRIVRAVVPETCMMYVTEEDEFTIGDGLHAVTGGCRHYDRSLIFTTKGTWMADGQLNEDGSFCLIPVNTTMGCAHVGGVAVLGNQPFTMFDNGLLRWNSDTDERNECNAEVVSQPVRPLFEEGFENKTRIWADEDRGEIWCYCPGEQGRVWVYQMEFGTWTSFDGFVPDLVFDMGDEEGIVIGQTLYRMAPDVFCDTMVTKEAPTGEKHLIEAEFQSPFLDFGSPEQTKRLCEASAIALCEGGVVTLTLQKADGKTYEVNMAEEGEMVCEWRRRVNVGRFRFLRMGIRYRGEGPLHLYCARLRTQKT